MNMVLAAYKQTNGFSMQEVVAKAQSPQEDPEQEQISLGLLMISAAPSIAVLTTILRVRGLEMIFLAGEAQAHLTLTKIGISISIP